MEQHNILFKQRSKYLSLNISLPNPSILHSCTHFYLPLVINIHMKMVKSKNSILILYITRYIQDNIPRDFTIIPFQSQHKCKNFAPTFPLNTQNNQKYITEPF